MSWNWLKIEIYDFNQYGCSPEKGFLYEMELLWKSFFPKTSIYFFKVYYYYTGCPKKRKIPYNGLKIEIYEFNQFSCSPEKFFLYEVETFCQNTYIYIYIYILYIVFGSDYLNSIQHISEIFVKGSVVVKLYPNHVNWSYGDCTTCGVLASGMR